MRAQTFKLSRVNTGVETVMRHRSAIAMSAAALGSRPRMRGAAVRRYIEWFLPVALLALILQILAPVGASMSAAATLADPLAGVEICHADPKSTSAPQGGDHHAGSFDCMLCCLSHAGGALDTPFPIALAGPARLVIRVVWQGQALDLPHAIARVTAQARAPPRLS